MNRFRHERPPTITSFPRPVDDGSAFPRPTKRVASDSNVPKRIPAKVDQKELKFILHDGPVDLPIFSVNMIRPAKMKSGVIGERNDAGDTFTVNVGRVGVGIFGRFRRSLAAGENDEYADNRR